jgi:hypothetical protein
MKPSRVRLAVCALLFLGWISWLVYLSATTTRPVVLSRPQFLAADLYVIAELRQGLEPRFRAEVPGLLFTAPSAGFPAAVPWGPVRLSTLPPKIRISEVIWPSALAGDLGGTELPVGNLALSEGWKEPGRYILPLTAVPSNGQNTYRVTLIPRSPGFPPRGFIGPPRIYPATPPALRELHDLIKEFHGLGR